jgi:flagellar basal body-associated protein FliL
MSGQEQFDFEDPESEPQTRRRAVKKSSSTTIIILLILVLVLAGGGLFFFFRSDGDQSRLDRINMRFLNHVKRMGEFAHQTLFRLSRIWKNAAFGLA